MNQSVIIQWSGCNIWLLDPWIERDRWPPWLLWTTIAQADSWRQCHELFLWNSKGGRGGSDDDCWERMCDSQNSFASVDEVIVQRKGARVHSTSPRHENILPSLFLIGKLPNLFAFWSMTISPSRPSKPRMDIIIGHYIEDPFQRLLMALGSLHLNHGDVLIALLDEVLDQLILPRQCVSDVRG